MTSPMPTSVDIPGLELGFSSLELTLSAAPHRKVLSLPDRPLSGIQNNAVECKLGPDGHVALITVRQSAGPLF